MQLNHLNVARVSICAALVLNLASCGGPDYGHEVTVSRTANFDHVCFLPDGGLVVSQGPAIRGLSADLQERWVVRAGGHAGRGLYCGPDGRIAFVLPETAHTSSAARESSISTNPEIAAWNIHVLSADGTALWQQRLANLSPDKHQGELLPVAFGRRGQTAVLHRHGGPGSQGQGNRLFYYSSDGRLIWQQDLPVVGWDGPAFSPDGVLCLTLQPEAEGPLVLRAIDAAGATAWERPLQEAWGKEPYAGKPGAPILLPGKVVAALDEEGELLWESEPAGDADDWFWKVSPAGSGMLWVQVAGAKRLLRLNAATGATVWSFEDPEWEVQAVHNLSGAAFVLTLARTTQHLDAGYHTTVLEQRSFDGAGEMLGAAPVSYFTYSQPLLSPYGGIYYLINTSQPNPDTWLEDIYLRRLDAAGQELSRYKSRETYPYTYFDGITAD